MLIGPSLVGWIGFDLFKYSGAGWTGIYVTLSTVTGLALVYTGT